MVKVDCQNPRRHKPGIAFSIDIVARSDSGTPAWSFVDRRARGPGAQIRTGLESDRIVAYLEPYSNFYCREFLYAKFASCRGRSSETVAIISEGQIVAL
jgi:hypothetical protein